MKNLSLPLLCLMIITLALPLNILSQSKNDMSNTHTSHLKHPIDTFKDKYLIKTDPTQNTISKGDIAGNGFLLTEKIRELWDSFNSTWMWQNTTFSTYNTDGLLSEEFTAEPVYLGTKHEFFYNTNGYLVQTLEYNFTNVWEIGGRVSYTYNTEYKPREILTEFFDGLNWNSLQRIVYTYNANQAEELYQSWTGSGWENGGRYLHTYDANNNLIQSVLQDWQNGNWFNLDQRFYTHDANNLLLEDLYQIWNGTSWFNHSRTLYTYNGLLNSTIVDEAWTGQWTFLRLTTKTYNANNLLIEEFIQTWDGFQTEILYYYDMDNNLVERTEEIIGWDLIRDRYLYSSANFLAGNNSNLNLVIPFNQPVSNTITISGGENIQNAIIDNVTVLIDEVLHPNVGELILTLEHSGVEVTLVGSSVANGINFIDTKLKDDAELTFTQGSAPYAGSFQPSNPLSAFSGLEATGDWTLTATDVVTGNEGTLEDWGLNIYLTSSSDVKYTETPVNDFKVFQNYPNPFNPSTKISWQSPIGNYQTLKVYDILSNEVATLVDEYLPAGTYETEFSADGLSSGIYFYKLQAGSFVETKKMILMK